MNADTATLLINSAFSLVELIARMRQENPALFVNQEEKIKALRLKLAALEEKPANYLENWDGNES
jgi:hypothetical protein